MKLLVSDYDLTLNCFNINVRFNMSFIEKFRKEGNLFFLNTGRNLESIKKEISRYRINFDYLACCDGNLVLNREYKPLYCTSLPLSILSDLENLKRQYHDILIEPILYNEQVLEYVVSCPLGDQKVYHDLLVLCQNNDLIIKKFPKVVFDGGCVKLFECFYIGKENVSKSSATSLIGELENIRKCDIFTIGDHLNDLEMINDFNGYTLPWGKKEVKEVSQGMVLSVASLVKKIMR